MEAKAEYSLASPVFVAAVAPAYYKEPPHPRPVCCPWCEAQIGFVVTVRQHKCEYCDALLMGGVLLFQFGGWCSACGHQVHWSSRRGLLERLFNGSTLVEME